MREAIYIGGDLSGDSVAGYRIAFSMQDSSVASYVQSVSLDGNEMQSDELYVTLRCRKSVVTVHADALSGLPDIVVTGYAEFHTVHDETFITSDNRTFLVSDTADLAEIWLSMFRGVTRNTVVWYDRTDDNGNRRLEKYYWKSMERVAKYDYDLTVQSPIGRLTSDFEGNLYDGQALPDVLAAVIGGIVPFTADYSLNAVRIYGWMPYQSRRECVHMLALACGFIVRRNRNRDLFFTLPPSDATELPDTVIFNGGYVDYRMGKTYARVDVTEYAFLRTANDKEITLFDNTDGSPAADNQTVKFQDAPVYGVTASDGLTLHSVGVNCAVVSGIGTLTGKAYTKVTSILSLPGDSEADPDAVLTVDGVPLITNLNSEQVAAKYRESANAPAVIEMDFIRRAENAGDFLSFTDPYGTPRTAYLLSMSGDVTSIDRVTAQLLAGYVHPWGNAYDSVTLLTGSGEWTVPESMDGVSVRIVLIAGGQGGESGQRGTDDTASGGGHGSPGSGGKVNFAKLTLNAGETFAYQCGEGGAGGVPSADYDTDERERKVYRNNPGSTGGSTTFGEYSSDGGAVSRVGYRDMIHGVQYAAPGTDNGIDGGAAASGRENGVRNNPVWVDVEFPTVTVPWSGQTWSAGGFGGGRWYHQNADGDYPAFDEWAYGGAGGGAAIGSNGGDGASVSAGSSDTGGRGGNGANALSIFPEDVRSYGSGGSGGHGGGEGGAGGTGNTTAIVLPSGNRADGINGARGSGGLGARGQAGKAGCILIYYHS